MFDRGNDNGRKDYFDRRPSYRQAACGTLCGFSEAESGTSEFGNV